MNAFLAPFWNRREHRPRAFWRLVLQAVAMLAALALLGAVLLIASTGTTNLGLQGAQEAIRAAAASDWYVLAVSFATLLAIAFSLWLAGRLWDRRPFADYGFHLSVAWWRDFAFGLGLGAFLLTVIFLIELAAGWVTVTGALFTPIVGQSFALATSIALVNFIFVGIREEMLSRGYQLLNLAEGLHWRWWSSRVAVVLAWVLASVVFGLLHAANPNASAMSTINLVLAGLQLGFGFILTRELAIPIGLHITWNFFEGNVYGFPVSGITGMPSFIAIEQSGPDLWTGGAFGPEAGLLNVVATVLGLALIWFWVRQTRGQVDIQARLAEYRRPGLPAVPQTPGAEQEAK